MVRTYDGKLNHAQVYNAMRVLCGDVKCTDCDVAGCHPSQVKIIRQVVPARDNVYQINQMDIAEAVSRRVKAQAGDHITDFSQEEYLSKLPVSPKTVDEVVDRLISGINLRSRVMVANMSLDQLIELKDWFSDGGGQDSEGRDILVNERDDLRRFPAPPPDVKAAERKELKDSDFGPLLPEID